MCEQDFANDPEFKREFLEEICIQHTPPGFPAIPTDEAEEFYDEIESFLIGLKNGRKRKKF